MNQLIAELDGFVEDLARDGAAGVEIVASASQQLARLERENTALRNEIARLNGQTMWICSCGGTDCEGQKENAALRDAIEESEEFARKNGEACGSKIRELLAENVALRELAARMAAEMREVDHEFASLRDYDAARKEAQP